MIVVFVGPSAAAEHLHRVLPEAVFRPPAHRGDVFHAARAGADRIVLIDGYFDTVPAVWHKELLDVLSRDVVVYGASSIGALRAAELERFGMIGVGEVFEQVRAGRVDDDDVAVAQDPEADGSTARSVAMVNIRWTLRAAAGAGVLGEDEARTLDRLAKSVHYPDRSYRRLVRDARRTSAVAPLSLDVFEQWLLDNAVDVKAADARLVAERVRRDLDAGHRPIGRPVHLPTTFFRDFVGEESARDGFRDEQWSVLDELRADPTRFGEARRDADRRRMCIEMARSAGVRPDQAMIDEAAGEFRQQHGLFDVETLEAWIADAGWTEGEYVAFIEREALRRWGEARVAHVESLDLLDVLRMRGDYALLARQARSRVRRLAATAVDDRLTSGDGVERRETLRQTLGKGFGPGLDDHALAAALGLVSVVALEGFLRVLVATEGDEPLTV